jgi:hypothetical protein
MLVAIVIPPRVLDPSSMISYLCFGLSLEIALTLPLELQMYW